MRHPFPGGDGVPAGGTPESRTEVALRTVLNRSAAAVPEVPGLVGKMHARAGRIRRTRQRLAATGATLTVLALAGVTTQVVLGKEAPGTATVQPADSARPAPRPTPFTAPPSQTPQVSTPPAEHTSIRPTSGDRGGSSGGWGKRLVDDDFDSAKLDSTQWTPYSGASNSPETVWSPAAVSQQHGELRLAVDRVGDQTPAITAGGVKLNGAGHRYGRWEVRWRMSAGYGVTGQFAFFGDGPGGIGHIATLSPATRSLTLEDLKRRTSQKISLDGTRFHTLTFESTPEHVRWLVDGDVVVTESGGAPSGPAVAAVQALVQGSDCGRPVLPSGCAGRASYPQHLDVDYARFWSYQP